MEAAEAVEHHNTSDNAQDRAPKASHEEACSARDDKDEDCCIVCFEQSATLAFVPCGHQCVCKTCAEAITDSGGAGKCPYCRTESIMTIQIYRQ